jgi:ubiquitin C-terminal hydrolase
MKEKATVKRNCRQNWGGELSTSTNIDLYDCLSEYFKTDTLDAQNKLFCQHCQNLSIAQMRFRIKQLPKILIIHLKRFSYNGTKLKNAVNFDEDIQIDAEYLALNS